MTGKHACTPGGMGGWMDTLGFCCCFGSLISTQNLLSDGEKALPGSVVHTICFSCSVS